MTEATSVHQPQTIRLNPNLRTNDECQVVRHALLSLVLPDVGLTVNEAWRLLNAHTRKLLDSEAPFQASTEASDLSLALWQAGIEYVVTEEGWPCAHEGWLFLANSDLAQLNFPQLDELSALPTTTFMRMLQD